MLCPDGVLLRLRERRQAVSPAQHDPVIGRHRRRKIVHAVCVSVYVWIRSLGNPYAVVCKLSIRTHRLALYTAGSHTFDKVGLEADKQDQDRHNGKAGAGDQDIVVVAVRGHQALQADRKRDLCL